MNLADPNSILQVRRLIKTSRERVFAAWTTPSQIPRWFGPATCRVLDAKIDLRVGGFYEFRVLNEPHGEMTVRGEYREVVSPEKLVFTWRWLDDPDWEDVASVVTVEFVEVSGGTEVRLTHQGFPSGESAGRHEFGWNACLDKLQIGAAAIAEMTGPGRFSWNELLSADVDEAAKFYTALFGWEAAPMAGGMPYTLFKKNGTEVAGLMKPPMPGAPAQWLPYVTVECADTEAARIAELGGVIVAPPFDIPKVGRIAVARDPQGAMFGVFQPETR
jgi:uncharacterized protein YndB with AHSA1/START domain/predicted enzyme related to lactoylglutathione lyase